MSKADSPREPRSKLLGPEDLRNIRWFWEGYLKARTGWLILVAVLVVIQGLIYQQFLSMTESGLRVIFDKGNLRDLLLVCFAVFGVIAFRGVLSYIVPRISVWVSAGAVWKLRNDLINHLLSLDLAYFEKTPPGETILRLTQQAESLSAFVGQGLIRTGRDAATVVIVAAYLAWQQPLLFAGAALVLPVIILLIQLVTQRIRGVQKTAIVAMKDYVDSVGELVGAMRTVKIAGQEEAEQRRLTSQTDRIRRATIRVQGTQALAPPFVDLAAAVVYALVIGAGGYMVISPDYSLDGASIITFLIGLVLIFDPGRRLAQFTVGLTNSLVILAHLREVFEETPKVTDHPDAVDTFNPLADIRFENVSFSYDPEQPLFQGLDLVIEGGKTTALVGPTGSGKTTALSLLGRLYDPLEGRITIGGQPIDRIRVAALRKAFSVVAQDIVIFDNSIWENIRYGRPDATDDEIWAAAEAAEIAELIRRRGNASVGPRGAQLSGGQKQRIAIARAFMREAPILLLDEATSALDQATEERIQAALNRLSEGRTAVIVAHRLSTVVAADRIHVFDGGRVVESGTHAELIAAGGLYAGLFESQSEGYRAGS